MIKKKIDRRIAKPTPSAEELLSVFEYKDGCLFWKYREGMKGFNNRFAGKMAGSTAPHGYIFVNFKYTFYLSHRIIWKMHHGQEAEFIDHIDGDRSNNRIENLRSVNATENMMNVGISSKNTSGITGISWDKRKGKWHCYIKKFGKRRSLMWSDDFFECCCARKSAEIMMGFHENHGKKRGSHA